MVLVVGQALINLGPAQVGKADRNFLDIRTEKKVGNDIMDADPRALDASMTTADTLLGDDVSVGCCDHVLS